MVTTMADTSNRPKGEENSQRRYLAILFSDLSDSVRALRAPWRPKTSRTCCKSFVAPTKTSYQSMAERSFRSRETGYWRASAIRRHMKTMVAGRLRQHLTFTTGFGTPFDHSPPNLSCLRLQRAFTRDWYFFLKGMMFTDASGCSATQ